MLFVRQNIYSKYMKKSLKYSIKYSKDLLFQISLSQLEYSSGVNVFSNKISSGFVEE